MKQPSIKYLKYYLLSISTVFILIISINIIVDPFGIFRFYNNKQFNSVKTGETNNIRLAKAGAVKKIKPKGVILGNSRAEFGINPLHPGWNIEPVYNLAISGANIYEIYRYFQHANNIEPLKEALFILDYNQFHAYWENSPDFDEKRLSITYKELDYPSYYLNDIIPTLFSSKALGYSLSTVFRSSFQLPSTYLSNGQRNWHDNILFKTVMQKFGNYSTVFLIEEEGLFLKRRKIDNNDYIESFFNKNTNYNVFDVFRNLVRLGMRDKIDIYFAIGPSHARYFECHRLVGNWFLWEEWKRNLINIIETEAQNIGSRPYKLWDFSGSTTLTMEPVPKKEDIDNQMEWYFESSHFTTDLGDLIQDRIFNYNSIDREVPKDFGVLVTSKNIDEHLNNVRKQNLNFRKMYPSIAKELYNLKIKYSISESYARDINGNNVTYKWY